MTVELCHPSEAGVTIVRSEQDVPMYAAQGWVPCADREPPAADPEGDTSA